MRSAPEPANEQERLLDLRSYDILDTPDEQAYDEITSLAAQIFAVPIALVSLVDANRQWFKSRVGLDAQQTKRNIAFCAHALLRPDVFVINDASQDQRFADNPLVTGQPGIRFYAGAPLITDDGHSLGTLCIIDREPRSLDADQKKMLTALARRVMTELQLRRASRLLRDTRDTVQRMFNAISDGFVAIDTGGCVTFIDDKASRIFGLEAADARGKSWDETLKLGAPARAMLRQLLSGEDAGPVSISVPRLKMQMEVRKAGFPDSMTETALILSDVTEFHRMRALLGGDTVRHDIVGRSVAMQNVFEQIEGAAPLDLAVVISGETGTGKELVARAIHALSHRHDGPFVAINCGALSEALLNSQLFGHRKGAFTGAIDNQLGLFEAAEGGTVFLDEIGDMPMALQVNLLRVLDNKEVTRIGETKGRPVDFRLLSASNRDLPERVADGAFREDLYYRLNAIEIEVPPLRERSEDIPLLIRHFTDAEALLADTEAPEFADETIALMMRHPWPGNVRQLRSVVTFAAAYSGGGVVRASDLPAEFAPPVTDPVLPRRPGATTSAELEQVLASTGGNKTAAARKLGISRATFYRRMREVGLKPD